MCTGIGEVALLVGALASVAGSVASSQAQQKQAKAAADARNAELQNFLKKNELLSAEAQAALQQRLDQEGGDPGQQLDPLQARREDAASESIDRASAAAPIPLAGNAPAVVANRAAGAQSDTDVEAKRRAAALAGTRSFGDLLFNKGIATGDAARKIGQVNTFAQANSRLLPIQQDLAQQSKAGVGSGLAKFGGISSALGSLASAGAGAGVFGGAASAAPLRSPTPVARPVNLGF